MSKNKKYTVRLANKGQINSNLYYGPYARDWWIPNLKIANNSVLNLPFHLYMSIITELFGDQTEHSGLAVFGFYNEEIISEILTNISSSIPGPGYTSSLLTCCSSETYLILQQVLDNYCSLQVYKGRNEVHQYVGETPIVIWKKYGMHQNRDHLALFRLKDPKVQALLTNKKEDIICTSFQWNDISILQQIFNLHIKCRKISMPKEDWHILFTKWITQQSTIVRLPHVLHSVYLPGYSFQHKKLAAWHSMFRACGYTNIMPYSKEESDFKFWMYAVDSRADRQTLKNLYQWELIQIKDQNSLCNIATSCQFWDSFRHALKINKRGAGRKIRILSIIASYFDYQVLKRELGVTSKTICKARKHSRLYSVGAPPMEMPKKTTKLMAKFKERQFKIFFSDKDNVTMSSYKTDPKTNLSILYLRDNKALLWKKFQQTFPNEMKKISFMSCIANYTHLKYQSDLEFNASLIRPKPIVSAHTKPISNWTIPILTIKVPSNNVISEDIEMEDVINFNDEEDYSEMDIEEDHVPKVTTIQNWIGRYSREFNQQGTSIVLETFKAMSSPNEEN
ncbi:27311_t:CDS:2, partial [Racocetra persica]